MSDTNEEKEQPQQQIKIENNTNLTPLTSFKETGMTSLNDDHYRSNVMVQSDNQHMRSFINNPFRSSVGLIHSNISGMGIGTHDQMISNLSQLQNKNTYDPIQQSNNFQKIGGPKIVNPQGVPPIEKQVKVPKWVGPMNQFTTFKSSYDAKKLGNQVEEILQGLVNKKQVDYARNNGCSFFGRMYSRNDLSEFQIQLYQNGQQNDTSTKTIFEIRRTSGDSFVHEDFFNDVTKQLSQNKYINLNENQNDFGGLEPLSLSDFILDDDDEIDEDEDDFEMLNDNTDVDMTDDDNSLTLEINDTKEWTQDLLQVLQDRDSYRDTWRHSATQLCYELQNNNKEMLDYVTKQKGILDKIFEPITRQLYDCLIIKTVLEIVSILLQNGVKMGNSHKIMSGLGQLEKDWEFGPKRSMGPLTMSFTRSQQILSQCKNCREIIKQIYSEE